MLQISGKQATLWQPPSGDIWRWIVVGLTLAQGDPVLRYNHATCTLQFLTPPPSQVERAALIAGTQGSAWSWTIDAQAYDVITALLGSPG